jgi:hypothetical protein
MDDLKEKIKKDREKIKAANEEYLIALRLFNSIKGPIEKSHRDILRNFREIINKKVESEHTCTCCSPRCYDDVFFTDNGILMRKDANHPNDIEDETWTWEEVTEILQEQKEIL